MEIAVKYAGFFRRFVALIIDSIILTPTFLIISFVSYYPAAEFGLENTQVAATRTYLIMFVCFTIYFAGFWAWRGQTPGKMALGIRVIKSNEGSLSIGRAILRFVGLISPIGIIIIIGNLVERFVFGESLHNPILFLTLISVILLPNFLIITLDGKKQAPHDKIAGTCVVRTR